MTISVFWDGNFECRNGRRTLRAQSRRPKQGASLAKTTFRGFAGSPAAFSKAPSAPFRTELTAFRPVHEPHSGDSFPEHLGFPCPTPFPPRPRRAGHLLESDPTAAINRRPNRLRRRARRGCATSAMNRPVCGESAPAAVSPIVGRTERRCATAIRWRGSSGSRFRPLGRTYGSARFPMVIFKRRGAMREVANSTGTTRTGRPCGMERSSNASSRLAERCRGFAARSRRICGGESWIGKKSSPR